MSVSGTVYTTVTTEQYYFQSRANISQHTGLSWREYVERAYPVLCLSSRLGARVWRYAQVQMSNKITVSKLWKLNMADCEDDKRKRERQEKAREQKEKRQ